MLEALVSLGALLASFVSFESSSEGLGRRGTLPFFSVFCRCDDGANQSGNCAQPIWLVSNANERKSIYRDLFFNYRVCLC